LALMRVVVTSDRQVRRARHLRAVLLLAAVATTT